MRIISLGWGCQSFTLAAMIALGELEPVDYAIYANTTHEFSGTYEFAKKWTPWLEEHGVRVVTVINKRKNDPTGEHEHPAYITYDQKAGIYGRLHRRCTENWKIFPIRRWLQAHRNGASVEQWIGISWDESQRMKDSDVKYITNRWPLIEKRMTRNDCIAWLKVHDLEVPPRSACTFCPYHSTREWQHIKASPVDWQEAVAVDRAIRKARPPYDLFVHPARKPLEDVDLRTEEERGQMTFDGWDSECSGICGV
jgi:3'-phosphoadenosine 5'-phosphosulfate sulfotransferase (PAPS reductase)/FAD synthetase